MLQFLASMLRSLRLVMMAEKQKIIFWLDSGAHFSVLPFSPGLWSNVEEPQGSHDGRKTKDHFLAR
jgi:hypothetical protein